MMNAKMIPSPTAKIIRSKCIEGKETLTHDAFNDEQPSPSLDTVCPLELEDGEGEQSTKSVTNLGTRVEDSGSESHSLFLIEDR